MKLKRRLSLPAMMVTTIIMAWFCSCSSPEILDLIPSDADYVATVDIADIIEKSGFGITGDEITGPSDLKTELRSISDNARKAIISLNKSLDIHQIILFGYAAMQNDRLESYALAKITDRNALDEFMSLSGTESDGSSDGFDITRYGDIYMLQSDGYLWIVQASGKDDAIGRIKKIKKTASDGNITANTRACNILNEHNAVNAVVNLNSFVDLISKYGYRMMDTQQALIAASILPKLKDNWLSATVSYGSTEIELTTKIFNPESGENLRLPLLRTIDSNALKHIPDDAIIAGTAGIDNGELSKIIDYVKPMIGRDPMLTIALAQIRKIDGTIGAALSTDNIIPLLTGDGQQSPDFTIFAEMQPESAPELKEFIENLASHSINCRVDGNVIIVSNSATQQSGNSRLTQPMEGKEFALTGEIPSFSPLTDGQTDIGAKAAVTYKDGELRILVAFSNVKGSLIAELIKLVNAIDSKAEQQHSTETTPF